MPLRSEVIFWVRKKNTNKEYNVYNIVKEKHRQLLFMKGRVRANERRTRK